MGTKSTARGAVATVGLLLLLGGILAGVVLFVLSSRQHDEIVETFARAPAGCTTTLEFAETGTFYVYVEHGGDASAPSGECVPVASGGDRLVFVIAGDAGPLTTRRDRSIAYDIDDFAGSSHSRFELTEPGTYNIVVASDDAETVAAIGRDPVAARDSLRRWAMLAGLGGVLGGGALLVVSGRRSKRAATPTTPTGPGWSRPGTTAVAVWPPQPPVHPQTPINPHQPDTFAPPFPNQVVEDVQQEPSNPRAAGAWAPPAAVGPVAESVVVVPAPERPVAESVVGGSGADPATDESASHEDTVEHTPVADDTDAEISEQPSEPREAHADEGLEAPHDGDEPTKD